MEELAMPSAPAQDHTTQARFQSLLEAHRGIVLKVAASYAFHPEDRAELAQEIAAQLWRAFAQYDPARPFSTWMYRIALNVAISQVRTTALRQRHAAPLDEDLHDLADPNAADPERDQQLRLLRGFMARQPPLERALLVLYLEDRPTREIAEILGLTQTNVTTKIARLKQRIRAEL
ncbi:sigma-70 family RNA polymerase sigma factor [Pseudoxanthomonas winnipegensis]|uniref:Sigma-70 family RNA polymerase sigma factor n=2 Tax=Lysobacteraceae TaxID=32033 RepID=A0A4Q8LGI6_9GAMM|nr:MAG: RNA polymerase subunit sigma-70 [Pseudoxanthomonas spadix]TAA28344.1 sigma-70 family RNA polymerase sigma factor [Pseudoxanthomonas winnipegensis]TMN24957.1 sigma-70 family RNA polymerase sigma factor [Pseudoxanthomonas sp. X-1]UAY73735.1 sigma-70 family RNA polymerase sigma factor [Pseudoxanthomonas sp. X-1]